jgi:hypothetical protein
MDSSAIALVRIRARLGAAVCRNFDFLMGAPHLVTFSRFSCPTEPTRARPALNRRARSCRTMIPRIQARSRWCASALDSAVRRNFDFDGLATFFSLLTHVSYPSEPAQPRPALVSVTSVAEFWHAYFYFSHDSPMHVCKSVKELNDHVTKSEISNQTRRCIVFSNADRDAHQNHTTCDA